MFFLLLFIFFLTYTLIVAKQNTFSLKKERKLPKCSKTLMEKSKLNRKKKSTTKAKLLFRRKTTKTHAKQTYNYAKPDFEQIWIIGWDVIDGKYKAQLNGDLG